MGEESIHRLPKAHSWIAHSLQVRLKIPLRSTHQWSLNKNGFALNKTIEKSNTARQKWQKPNLPNFSKDMLVNYSTQAFGTLISLGTTTILEKCQ